MLLYRIWIYRALGRICTATPWVEAYRKVTRSRFRGRGLDDRDDDRGYLIEAWSAEWGLYVVDGRIREPVHPTYTVTDDGTCSIPHPVLIYTVEKHGFSLPLTIPCRHTTLKAQSTPCKMNSRNSRVSIAG